MTNGNQGADSLRVDSLRVPAERCHAVLVERGQTVATAESVTGGLLGAVLTGVAGASETYGGGVIAYTERAKQTVLGVPADVLAEHGPVHERTAEAMAIGARTVFDTTYVLATTGVAGPDSHGGQPVGTVLIACAGPESCLVERLQLAGDRARIRVETVRASLAILERMLAETSPGRG